MPQVVVRLPNLRFEDFFVGEVLKDCDQDSESLVESQDIGPGWDQEMGPHSIYQCVCEFMHDYVVRYACIYRSAGHVAPLRRSLGGIEVPEPYLSGRSIVGGVCALFACVRS